MQAKALIGCEHSGIVRDAFIQAGIDAISCDLLPSETPGPHYIGDIFDILGDGFDLMISFPPCTYLCNSGIHWNTKRPNRAEDTRAALAFFAALYNAPIRRICIENPIGIVSNEIIKPNQIIQPWQFGHDASKSTCLWLKNLPHLRQTHYIAPRMIDGLPRWENQTDSGQNKLPPSNDRWKLRSKTYAGIAKAMADQWAPILCGDDYIYPSRQIELFTEPMP